MSSVHFVCTITQAEAPHQKLTRSASNVALACSGPGLPCAGEQIIISFQKPRPEVQAAQKDSEHMDNNESDDDKTADPRRLCTQLSVIASHVYHHPHPDCHWRISCRCWSNSPIPSLPSTARAYRSPPDVPTAQRVQTGTAAVETLLTAPQLQCCRIRIFPPALVRKCTTPPCRTLHVGAPHHPITPSAPHARTLLGLMTASFRCTRVSLSRRIARCAPHASHHSFSFLAAHSNLSFTWDPGRFAYIEYHYSVCTYSI